MKLARKLSLALIAAVFIVFLLFAYIRVQREVAFFDTDMRTDHLRIGTTLATAVDEMWIAAGQDAALGLVRRVDHEREYMHLRWVWLDGPTTPEASPHADLRALTGARDGSVVQLVARVGSRDDLLTYVPVKTKRTRTGALEISEPLGPRSYVQQTVTNTILAGLVIAAVGAALAIGLGRWMVGNPVQRLIEKARRVGNGDLSGPLTLDTGDELAELADELNAMCVRLSEANAQLLEEASARASATHQLRHAERLTTIGRLASAIAHELGTPLNVVSGHARLIAKGKVEGAEVAASAGAISEQTERMTSIVKQVLEFARRGQPRKSTVDLADVVRSAVDFLGPLASRAGVQIATSLPRGHSVEIDAFQIQQAITNLLVNAVQATAPGGTVEIALQTENARIRGEGAETPCVVASVRDRGSGMADDTLARIFEPFFTTKSTGEGTGLGLSITREIIEEHGGWIEVTSKPGEGSCFKVYFRQSDPA